MVCTALISRELRAIDHRSQWYLMIRRVIDKALYHRGRTFHTIAHYSHLSQLYHDHHHRSRKALRARLLLPRALPVYCRVQKCICHKSQWQFLSQLHTNEDGKHITINAQSISSLSIKIHCNCTWIIRSCTVKNHEYDSLNGRTLAESVWQ